MVWIDGVLLPLSGWIQEAYSCRTHLWDGCCDRRRRQRAHDHVSGPHILVALNVDTAVDCDQAKFDAVLQL